MTRLLTMACVFILTTGCATHYYKVKGNTIELYLDKPDAEQVLLFSSLDGFEPHPARNNAGRWVVTLPSDSQFRYYYILDDQFYLPPCRMKENDDFGAQNCIYDPQL